MSSPSRRIISRRLLKASDQVLEPRLLVLLVAAAVDADPESGAGCVGKGSGRTRDIRPKVPDGDVRFARERAIRPILVSIARRTGRER